VRFEQQREGGRRKLYELNQHLFSKVETFGFLFGYLPEKDIKLLLFTAFWLHHDQL